MFVSMHTIFPGISTDTLAFLTQYFPLAQPRRNIYQSGYSSKA